VPAKADSILPVDTDAVLPCPCAGQSLKPVTGRIPQILQTLHSMKLPQTAKGGVGDVMKRSRTLPLEYLPCILIREAADHFEIVTEAF